jgi:hypothetical protein
MQVIKKKNTSCQANATAFGYEFDYLRVLYRYNCIGV